MKNLSIISVFVAALLAVSCKKEAAPAPEHPYSQQELCKQKVADALDIFFEKLDPASITSPVAFVAENSRVQIGLDGRIVYSLVKDDATLVHATFFFIGKDCCKVSVHLYGGVEMLGTSLSTLEVYLDGQKMACLGLEWLDRTPLPVLRYPDGTSYALSSFLITDALIDFLLTHVLSTE